ncbi:MAG: 1-deoxy-D-xylulose-5-phosphate synthase, partial [Actinomycetota bacterium]
GVGVTVIDPRWVKPLPKSLVTMAQRYKNVVVLEDGIKHGGIASTISELFRDAQLNVPVHSIGLPLTFLEHSKRAEILEDLGITVQNITRSLVAWNSSEIGIDVKEGMPHPLDENERRKPLR